MFLNYLFTLFLGDKVGQQHMLNYNKHVFDEFSVDRFNDAIRGINHNQNDDAVSVLMDKHVKIYDERLFNQEIQNFQNSDKKLGILKSNVSGVLLKGFFRLPNLSANIIFLKQKNDFKVPPIIEPNLFYTENQASLLIRKYVEENYSEENVFFIGLHEGRVPISILHERRLINHFPSLGFYTISDENFTLSQKQIKNDINQTERGTWANRGVYSIVRRFLKRASGSEIKKNYD